MGIRILKSIYAIAIYEYLGMYGAKRGNRRSNGSNDYSESKNSSQLIDRKIPNTRRWLYMYQ